MRSSCRAAPPRNRRVEGRWRNGWLSNTTLAVSLLLFLVLAVNEIRNAV